MQCLHGGGSVPCMMRKFAEISPMQLSRIDLNLFTVFDAASSQRGFTIAVRESHEVSFLPELIRRVHREAANIDVAAVRIDRRDLEEDLQSGDLDAAVDVALPLSADVRRERLQTEPMVVLVRADHPAIRDALDID